MPFTTVPFTTDAESLADDALARLQEHWEDWEPNDADLEVIIIETLSGIAQDAIETASEVPTAIFRQFGEEILGVPYQGAEAAEGVATFTAVDAAGYDSTQTSPDDDGLVQIAVGTVAFETDDPVIILPGETTVDVAVTATELGTVGNGLSGNAEMITALAWVSLITVAAPTTGGVDAESDADYLDRIADRMQLRAETLVTGRDFEVAALAFPAVGRAVAIVGSPREVTVAVTDADGEALSSDVKDEIEAYYSEHRQVNTVYNVVDPQYSNIAVTFTAVSLPGYENAALEDLIISSVSQWLSPANWGKPANMEEGTTWVLDNKVRYNELLRVIGQVPGVRYVSDATLNGARVDVTMPAADGVALPRDRKSVV